MNILSSPQLTPPERQSPWAALFLAGSAAFLLAGCGGGGGGSSSGNSNKGDHIPSGYTITDLGALPGGTSTYAEDINSRGDVVGIGNVGSGTNVNNAFLYSNGQITDLGTLTGGTYSIAWGINDSGQIGGYSQKADGTDSVVLWTSRGMTDLGTLGGDNGTGYGIGPNKEVVGTAQDFNDDYHAFVNKGNMLVDLGTLPGDVSSVAARINGHGQVVGNSGSASRDAHAYLYSDGHMMALPPLGGTNSYAVGINTQGDVVGDAQTVSDNTTGGYHAFLYSGGKITNLGTLPGAPESQASAINDSGLIVGDSGAVPPATSVKSAAITHSRQSAPPLPTPESFSAQTRSSAIAHPAVQIGTAYVYFQGTMVNLNTLIPAGSGWILDTPTGINNNGQICGWGTIGGETHAFLLTPASTGM